MNVPDPDVSRVSDSPPPPQPLVVEVSAQPDEASGGRGWLMKPLSLLGMLSGGVLVVGAALGALGVVVVTVRETTTKIMPTLFVTVVIVVLPFLLGRFLWKKGRSAWEGSEPSQGAARRIDPGALLAALRDFLHSKGEVTVTDLAGFFKLPEQKSEELIQMLIARGEINLAFVPEKGVYVVPPFIPAWAPAIPQPSVVEPIPLSEVGGGKLASSGVVLVSTRRLEHRCPSCNAPQDLDGASPGDKRVCPYCGIAFQLVDASASP